MGTIKSSNLCTEIIEYSSPDETAVCNLASLALPSFIENGVYDFKKLHAVTKVITYNLNRIIDVNYYPIPEAKRSNFRHRPIGVGVQGLADAFMALRMPFDSQAAKELNIKIFETIYHASLEASCELAERDGPYETWMGSPAQQGQLQYDLWGVTPTDLWDWTSLKAQIARHGLRNSLLVAPMPTASTSQILGNNECFEPYTSNIYTRRVLAGEFQVVCPWLLRELVDLGLWDDNMKNMIIAHNGSIQNIPNIPDDTKAIYKTVWEISQKKVLDLAADRGAFICQSQSLNVHLQAPTMGQLTSMHFYGWKKGLKTGMYYLRTRPAAQAIQFTVDQSLLKEAKRQNTAAATASKVAVSGTPAVAPAPVASIPTPVSSKAASPVRSAIAPATPTKVEEEPKIKEEPITPVPLKFLPISSSSTPSSTSSPAIAESSSTATLVNTSPESKGKAADVSSINLDSLSLDEKTRKAAEADPEFAAALIRKKEREYEEEKLMCSLENKEACLMCSG